MNPFHGQHFQGTMILWAVRGDCKYGIRYRELQEMLAECGVNVDHTTLKPLKKWEIPKVINTDKALTYAKAPVSLKQGGKMPYGHAAATGEVPEQRH